MMILLSSSTEMRQWLYSSNAIKDCLGQIPLQVSSHYAFIRSSKYLVCVIYKPSTNNQFHLHGIYKPSVARHQRTHDTCPRQFIDIEHNRSEKHREREESSQIFHELHTTSWEIWNRSCCSLRLVIGPTPRHSSKKTLTWGWWLREARAHLSHCTPESHPPPTQPTTAVINHTLTPTNLHQRHIWHRII